VDELIATALMDEETLHMMEATEDYLLYDPADSFAGDVSTLSDEELIHRYLEHQHHKKLSFENARKLCPSKFLIVVVGTLWFIWRYYANHCVPDEKDPGHLVSKPMHLPKNTHYTWMNAFMPWIYPTPLEDKPFWQMPPV
jgi:hypothetical protein